MSLSTILCKTKNFQTWNEECLIYVILGIKFEKLLPYLKSALLSQSKCKVPRKDKNLKIWDKKCSFLDIFKLKSLKSSIIRIITLRFVKRQVVENKKVSILKLRMAYLCNFGLKV